MLKSIINPVMTRKNTFMSLILLFIAVFAFAQTPEWQWATQAGGSDLDTGYSISLDEAGNSYVAGYFFNTATFGSTSLTSNGDYDIFVAKLDANGNWQWATQAGGTSYDRGYSISLDAAGNSYIIGVFKNTATFGSTSLTSSGEKDIFVAKLDANGNWQWATQAGGSSIDNGQSICLDDAGNSHITGYFEDTATFGSTSLTSSGEHDIFVAKLDANGNWQWATQAGGSSYNYGHSISLDEAGNSYITGGFKDTATFGSTSLTSSGSYDIFVAMLDANGNWQWVTQAGGSSGDYGHSMTLDEAGNSYITGGFKDTANFGSTSLTSSGEHNIFVAKLDTNGNWQWAIQAGGSSYDTGYSISLDEAGNSYVAGYFEYTATFGLTSLTSNGYFDIFVAKLDANGNWQWVTNAGGVSNDFGISISLDEAGNSYVTGYFKDTATFDSTSLTSSGGGDIFVAKLGYNIIADFTADQTSVPLGNEIQFTDLSTNNPTSWEWDFENDGIIDSYEQNPNNSYAAVGIYTVSLTVYNEYSTDTEIKVDYINVTSTSTNIETIPLETMLIGNYPNPFNPSTKINFSIQNNSKVELTISNNKGQKIKTLVQNELTNGNHSIVWNGDDEYGKAVSSGIYLYKLIVNSKTEAVKKCLLLK